MIIQQFNKETFDLYNSAPSSIPLQMNAGAPFSNVDSNIPGISVGMALTSIIHFPYPQDNLLYTMEVPGNTTLFLPLSSFTLPAGCTLVEGGSSDNTYLDFGYGCSIYFSSDDEAVNTLVSGYDIYEQKLTYGVEVGAGENGVWMSPRCAQKYTSVQVTNSSSNATSVKIYLAASRVELPYYDFGRTEFLLGVNYPTATTNYVNAQITSVDNKYFEQLVIRLNCSANPFAPNMTLFTGTVRSIIDVLPNPSVVFSETTSQYISIRQSVFGCGTPLPKGLDLSLNGEDMAPFLVNNPITVIGGTQYSTGWTGWRG